VGEWGGGGGVVSLLILGGPDPKQIDCNLTGKLPDSTII